MSTVVSGHRRTERGASSVEYALMLAGVALVLLVVIGPLGNAITKAIDPACQYIANTNCTLGG